MLVREIRSLEILSVKKEAKLSASEVTEAKVMKICDVVIYLQFARDGGDFQMRKKLSLSSIAF